MLLGMAKLHEISRGSLGRRILRFGVRRGLRSVEVDPEDFRRQLANKHGLWVPNFARMQDVPLERLDEIAKVLIRDAERLALAEGAGFGLGGMITFLPDASLLTAITLRLIQRLCMLYGFESRGTRRAPGIVDGGRGGNRSGLRKRFGGEASHGKTCAACGQTAGGSAR
jgi:hypothetical protein